MHPFLKYLWGGLLKYIVLTPFSLNIILEVTSKIHLTLNYGVADLLKMLTY
jgi:hypothetical protein